MSQGIGTLSKEAPRGLSRGTRGVTQVGFAMLLIDTAVTTIVGGVSILRTIILYDHSTRQSTLIRRGCRM